MIEAIVQFVARAEPALGIELDATRTRLDRHVTQNTPRPAAPGSRAARSIPGGVAAAALVTLAAVAAGQSSARDDDPTPQSIEEFQSTAARILWDTGVPGAGIALVRADGVEWEGGLGYADLDRQTPVTADTPFRAGSISKTFVALALVQLAEDGHVDLEDPVEEIVADISIDNPWRRNDPVRVLHLLEHTAGFDDMHFKERYVVAGAPDLSLEAVLRLNPRSRRVRWQPGTRPAYSNPGYALAGFLVEHIAGEPYEDYIAREIFVPLGMSRSSFRLTAADEGELARGYAGPDSAPVGFPRIHLRPAGNLHSSAHDLGRFVRMLLNWGELDDAFVVDPEYLGSMEQPRTTLASRAGLRLGYGAGIAARVDLPFPVLGHSGSIDGFTSAYAYSPSRDAGFVVLLNSSGARAREALTRMSSLAIRYLKREVRAPSAPDVHLDAGTLDQYAGYYHEANPRSQITWPVQWLLDGRTIQRDGQALVAAPLFQAPRRLIAVSETTFRYEDEVDASMVFTRDAGGTMVLAGASLYAERRPRWRIELVRGLVVTALAAIASVLLVAPVWAIRMRRARPRGFWWLKVAVLACPLTWLAPLAALALTSTRQWGLPNSATAAVFLATLAVPSLAALVTALALAARRDGASRWLVVYALVIAYAMAAATVYLAAHDLMGLRMWRY